MKSAFMHKSLVIVLGLVLLGVCASIGVVLYKTKRELVVLEARETNYRQLLADKSQRYQERHAYLKKMLEDPIYFEKVVRERLGYSRDNEIIFRFPEE